MQSLLKRFGWTMLALGVSAHASCGFEQTADWKKCLPDDSGVVYFVDVHAVRKSAIVQKLIRDKTLPADIFDFAWSEKQIASTDKDRRELILKILKVSRQFALAGPESDWEEKGAVFFLIGDYGRDIIADAFQGLSKKSGAKLKTAAEKVGNHDLYTMSDTEGALFVAIVDNHLLVASDNKQKVEDALAKADGRNTVAISKGLSDMLARVPAKDSIWMASGLSDRSGAMEIGGFLASLRVADDVKVTFVLRLATEDTAEAWALRGMKPWIECAEAIAPGLAVVSEMKNVKIDPDGPLITLTGVLTAECVTNRLFKASPKTR